MSTPVSEIALRAAALANRLRLVQIDFADESPEVRRDQLCEEIERAMKPLVPDQRRELLQELSERFPSWDPNVLVGSGGAGSGGAGGAKLRRARLSQPRFNPRPTSAS